MLKVKNLKKYFGGVRAVNNCSFEIREGKITALIGPNGAGKSTVYNIISGILKPEHGRVIFDGEDITGVKPERVSNLGISRLFQHSRLFGNLTVRENLLLALDNEDTRLLKNLSGKNRVSGEREGRVKEILELVGMEEFRNKLSRDLSYGQKRLVELARTILNPHKLLMLDEPVAGVNPKLRKSIAGVLLKLKEQGEAILLIEHDMHFTLKIADDVIVMDEGKIIAEGKPSEIRNNPRVLEAYLE